MRLPKYWSKGEVEVEDRKGRKHKFSAWGWSDTSKQDAERRGRERATAVGGRVLNREKPMRYLYGTSPLREEVVRQFQDREGRVHSAITINSYGCHVLNSTELIIIDVDLPRTSQLELVLYSLIKLVASNSMHPRHRREAAQLSRLEEFNRLNPNIGIRVYRTHSGLRYLFTNHKMKPASDETAKDMQFLNADPLYVKLCKMQECFRARLTPKPWRCGLRTTTIHYPRESDREKELYQSWNQEYMKLSDGFATCKYIREYGKRFTTEIVAELLRVHDQFTKANTDLPLA